MTVEAQAHRELGREATGTVPADLTPWPNATSAWWCVVMLSIALALSQIDRNIITLLVAPIKKDFALSDVKVSLLLGPSFIVLYVFMGLPLSRLTDTKSRRVMIILGLTFWSLMTAACGLAQSFDQLFLARVGIGAGESVNGPATYSMLADYFPRERLPRALAVLNVGFVAGIGFSLIAGGLVIGALTAVPTYHLPLIGDVRSWQLVFIAIGLPGLVAAGLMTSVKEPVRRGLGTIKPTAPTVREVIDFLRANRNIYAPMIGGIGITFLLSTGVQNWGPVFYERTYGWSAREAGFALGIATLVASPIGLAAGAWLAERLSRTYDDANVRVAVLAYLLAIPFEVIGPLMPNPWLALIGSGIGIMAAMMGATPFVAALQSVTPNQMRAQISALYLFVLSGVAGGLGAVVFGAITDYIVRNESAIRYTMSGAAAVMGPLAVIIIWRSMRPYGRAISAIKAAEAGAATTALPITSR